MYDINSFLNYFIFIIKSLTMADNVFSQYDDSFIQKRFPLTHAVVGVKALSCKNTEFSSAGQFIPLTATLRISIVGLPENGSSPLYAFLFDKILPAIEYSSLNLLSVRIGDIKNHFDIGRLVLETDISVSAIMKTEKEVTSNE